MCTNDHLHSLRDTPVKRVDPMFRLQYRTYLVEGLDRYGEYGVCFRTVTLYGTSEAVCEHGPIYPVSVESDEVPNDISLSQNYPNPFNPSTTVTYTLDRTGPVEISVYDLSGRIVSTLVDGVRPAGNHEAWFSADDLPTGSYIYRLQAGTETLTRTMTLIR